MGRMRGRTSTASTTWMLGSTEMVAVTRKHRRRSLMEERQACGGQWWWDCRILHRRITSFLTCVQHSHLATRPGKFTSAGWSG